MTSGTRFITPLGVMTAILGFLSFSILDIFVKYSSQFYSVYEISFYLRLFGGSILIIANTIRSISSRTLAPFRMNVPISHLIRALMLIPMSLLFTKGFSVLPLSNAYSLVYTLPLITALLGGIFLKEHISLLTWGAIVVGFIGVLIILRPGLTVVPQGYIFILLAVVIEAPMFLLIRLFHKDEHPFTTLFYPVIFTIVILGVLIIVLDQSFEILRLSHVFMFMGMGIASCSAQGFIAYSLKTTDAHITLSMQYTQMIWGILAGWLLFKDIVFDPFLMVGTIIIIFAGYTVITHRLPFMRARSTSDSGM